MRESAANPSKANAHGASSTNPLTRKLSHFVPLSPADCHVIDSLTSVEERLNADVDIITKGRSRAVFLILEGMAFRYRSLQDGGRQIMTFLIPGDLCDIHAFLGKPMDHSIGTITPVRLANIPRDRMMDVFTLHPRISVALWWSSMQEEAMLRERIVALGRRDARGRIAYLFCELLWRHAAIGLSSSKGFPLPLTQTELGDTLGLTPVHVNRILKEFRSSRLITMENRMIDLLDVPGLQNIAGFTKDYLQFGGISQEIVEYFADRENRNSL